MQINWGLGQGPNAFDKAFGTGVQIGQAARQQQGQSALAAYAVDQSEENLANIAKYKPEFVLQEKSRMADQQKQQGFIELRKRALAGDREAQLEIAAQDNAAYDNFTDQQKKQSDEADKMVANALFQIESLPLEQRAAAWDAVVTEAGTPELAGMYGPEAVRAIAAKGGVSKALQEMGAPKYLAIPEGGTLVNTRDPRAISQFGRQENAPPPPPGFQLDEGGPASAPGNFPQADY